MFLPIDCLNSLANVSRCPENRVDLLKTNVLASYEAMLSRWLDQRNGCEPVGVGNQQSPPDSDGHLEASSAVLPTAATLQAGFDANGAGMDAEEEEAAEEEAEEEAVAEEVGGEALGSEEAESSEEGDSDSEGEDEEEGEQALAQSTSAVDRKTAEPDKVVVSRDVDRVEVELVVATIGTLALSCRRASHTSTSSASQDSERGGGNELSSSGPSSAPPSHFVLPEVAFEGLHSKLLPLLQRVGAYACWREVDSVATTHLGTLLSLLYLISLLSPPQDPKTLNLCMSAKYFLDAAFGVRRPCPVPPTLNPEAYGWCGQTGEHGTWRTGR